MHELWMMMTMDAWIMNDDDDRNRDDRVVHRRTSSTINSSSLIIIFSFSSFAFGSFGRLRKCRFYWEEHTKTRNPLVFLKGNKKKYHKLCINLENMAKLWSQEPPALFFFIYPPLQVVFLDVPRKSGIYRVRVSRSPLGINWLRRRWQ